MNAALNLMWPEEQPGDRELSLRTELPFALLLTLGCCCVMASGTQQLKSSDTYLQ